MTIEFKLPDLGENIEGGDVVNVLVEEGSEVEAEQNVIEMETEKAVVEVPCPHSGRVKKIHVKSGEHVAIGDLVLTLDEGNGSGGKAESAEEAEAAEEDEEGEKKEKAEKKEEKETEEKKAGKAEKAAEAEKEREREEEAETGEEEEAERAEEEEKRRPRKREKEPSKEKAGVDRDVGTRTELAGAEVARQRVVEVERDGGRPAPAGPATRRLARELGVDLHEVDGSGPGGRITRDDVKGHVRAFMEERRGVPEGRRAETPALPDFSQWGEVERRPLKGIRKATVASMSVAWGEVAHVTQLDRADVTALEAARKRHEESRSEDEPKITVTAIAIKAAVAALKAFPRFNTSLDAASGELIFKHYHHIGVAVDTEHGLLVPVIRDADRKTVTELAAELADVAARARERKIDLSDMKGGTFTITNLGGIGGTAFTPIVNWPEVAILGMARARPEVVLEEGVPTTRLILPLSLSYDHRVIDGADGARFLRYVARALEDPFRMILDI